MTYDVQECHRATIRTYEPADLVSNRLVTRHDPLVYCVEALLARKLGLGDALEDNSFCYTAALRTVAEGLVHYEDANPYGTTEAIRMAGILVVVHEGLDRIPQDTLSYSHARWVTAQALLDAIAERDPSLLHSGLDPLDFCIHGLCITTSDQIIAADLKRSDDPREVCYRCAGTMNGPRNGARLAHAVGHP
jgi:hypothetical protein